MGSPVHQIEIDAEKSVLEKMNIFMTLNYLSSFWLSVIGCQIIVVG